jgi:levanase/fructan beta-fructosidase
MTSFTVALAIALAPAVISLGGAVAPSDSDRERLDYPEFPYPVTNYQEDNRGQFHFSARGGWINDVNAPLYYNGVYHLYYQHNPHGLAWDTMHWGHATSEDLVHWKQKPIALEPGVHPGDLFSGGGVVDTANVSGLRRGAHDPIVVYSGTNGVTVFYSLDGGYTFESYNEGRPVVVPPGTSRDPMVFRYEPAGIWGMVVWSDEGGNGVNFYTSHNLLDWTFASRYQADWLFECPNLIAMPLDGDPATIRWVLHDASGEYVVGDFDGTTFTSDWTSPKRLNQGLNAFNGSYYAGLTFANMPDDRIVSMAWQPGNHGSIWTGNLTFPVELRLKTLDDGMRVVATPVREIEKLRTSSRTWHGRVLDARRARQLLADVRADLYEIDAEFDVAGFPDSRFGFRLHTSDDGWFDREVLYDTATQTLDGVPLKPVDGRVRMRLLVDRGQLEIFGNDGEVYRSLNVNFDSMPGGDGVELVVDGRVRLRSLALHELGSIWRGESMLASDVPGQWYAASGLWSDVADGKQGRGSGDVFYLNTAVGDDFTYEGDVRVDDGVAAALTFRSTKDAARHYTVNVDVDAQVVKLWRPGRDIATYRTSIERGRTYYLKVVAQGPRLRVFLDGGSAPVIDAVDDTIRSGQFGLNVFNGTGVFQNIRLGPAP